MVKRFRSGTCISGSCATTEPAAKNREAKPPRPACRICDRRGTTLSPHVPCLSSHSRVRLLDFLRMSLNVSVSSSRSSSLSLWFRDAKIRDSLKTECRTKVSQTSSNIFDGAPDFSRSSRNTFAKLEAMSRAVCAC
jgi:hypothetical protein